MWQHVKLSVQIRPWDTLACCWDVKQPTNKQTAGHCRLLLRVFWVTGTTRVSGFGFSRGVSPLWFEPQELPGFPQLRRFLFCLSVSCVSSPGLSIHMSNVWVFVISCVQLDGSLSWKLLYWTVANFSNSSFHIFWAYRHHSVAFGFLQICFKFICLCSLISVWMTLTRSQIWESNILCAHFFCFFFFFSLIFMKCSMLHGLLGCWSCY